MAREGSESGLDSSYYSSPGLWDGKGEWLTGVESGPLHGSRSAPDQIISTFNLENHAHSCLKDIFIPLT